MSYPNVPQVSKNKIDKAALLVSRGFHKTISTSYKEVHDALNLVNAWRVSHAYPLNTFNVGLREKTRNLKDAIVAQRLKRMPTILDKLIREPSMQLTTMQDIGGVRAIVNNIEDVYRIAEKYKKTSKHPLLDEHDYINMPRGEDGYRSYHLIFKYHNNLEKAQQYNGLRIEVQLRTKLQHSWATAVETMGVILGQQLKSRKGEKRWLLFFSSVSAAFAHIEGTTLVPGYEHLSKKETFELVSKREKELNVIEKFSGFSIAMRSVITRHNNKGRPKNGYFLLRLDKSKHLIEIRPYSRDDATRASQALEKLEEEALSNPNLDALLVSVGPLDELRKAYPNYFLDVSEFVKQLRKIIGQKFM